jgi:hypothetical protein
VMRTGRYAALRVLNEASIPASLPHPRRAP